MARRKTLVVVGAGANAEFGLPTGTELKSDIARRLDIRFEHGITPISGDMVLLESIRVVAAAAGLRDLNPYLHAAWAIRDAMPQAMSIDNFIDVHGGNAKIASCGKLAIVQSILTAEKESKLYINPRERDRSIDFSSVDATWANRLTQMLFQNCRVEALAERLSSFVFVIFNYDRCLEHYLHHSLQNYYRISSEAAAALLASVEIYHPYGQVGHLPWTKLLPVVEFGADAGPQKVVDLTAQIRTFTEGTTVDGSRIEAIRSAVSESAILLFLGFAFHTLNMKLLRSENKGPEPRSCFATARGISDHDCKSVYSDIVNLSPGPWSNIFVRNELKCGQLFEEYWRTFSLAENL